MRDFPEYGVDSNEIMEEASASDDQSLFVLDMCLTQSLYSVMHWVFGILIARDTHGL